MRGEENNFDLLSLAGTGKKPVMWEQAHSEADPSCFDTREVVTEPQNP
jgi:hypothetical protein